MKALCVLGVGVIIFGFIGSAFADHVDDRDFTKRDPANEWFICHTTDDHRNDIFLNNHDGRDYCNGELEGHVLFVSGADASFHVAQSKSICAQLNKLCKAPG